MIGYFIAIVYILYDLDTKYYNHEVPERYIKNVPFINICFTALILLLLRLIITEPMIITIDLFAKSIRFKNMITRYSKTYSFENFDGYVESTQKSGYGNYKVFYLIQNKRVVEKIKGYYYNNIDELGNGINSLVNLGNQKMTLLKRMKILFKVPILT